MIMNPEYITDVLISNQLSHCKLPANTIIYFLLNHEHTVYPFSSENLKGCNKTMFDLMSEGIVHHFFSSKQFNSLRNVRNRNRIGVLVSPIVLRALALSW